MSEQSEWWSYEIPKRRGFRVVTNQYVEHFVSRRPATQAEIGHAIILREASKAAYRKHVAFTERVEAQDMDAIRNMLEFTPEAVVDALSSDEWSTFKSRLQACRSEGSR